MAILITGMTKKKIPNESVVSLLLSYGTMTAMALLYRWPFFQLKI